MRGLGALFLRGLVGGDGGQMRWGADVVGLEGDDDIEIYPDMWICILEVNGGEKI